VSAACDRCLRRSQLLAHLAPRIAGLLDRPGRRVPSLLSLDEPDLIAALAPGREREARELLDRFDGDAQRRRLAERDIRALCRHGRAWPRPLDDLADPPAVLYVAAPGGRLRAFLESPAVAVVGTRRPSPYGREMAYAVARGLGAAGLTVVSGLALGLDAVAHRACLDAGGHALAVLGGGPDVPYPRRNRALHERIRRDGLLLSELPPGQRPFRWSFPARNRLMAALSAMTVVVEAAEPSGSLITAEFAQDLGRPVGAVPGRATAAVAAGTNGLLRDGARLISGPEDVLDELFGVGAGPRPGSPGDAGPPIDPELRPVLDAIEAGEGIDGIVRVTGLTPGRVRAAFARLEAGGHVVRSPLGKYERAARR
jgi:DNA processing protein